MIDWHPLYQKGSWLEALQDGINKTSHQADQEIGADAPHDYIGGNLPLPEQMDQNNNCGVGKKEAPKMFPANGKEGILTK